MSAQVREAGAPYPVTPLAEGLLIDTHAALWWFIDDRRLPPKAREAIADPARPVYFSAVSGWELATKARIGKLPELPDVAGRLPGFVSGSGFKVLPVQLDHATRAGDLPLHHRDPFDRMLVAQSLIEGLTVITRDGAFAQYGCKTLW